jgi:dihydroorotate dehydrogenase
MSNFDFFRFARPVLHALTPETAHNLTIKALSAGFYNKDKLPDDPRLGQTVFGIHFTNPVGMAAGFDKNAEVLKSLFSFGFGFIEAGTVTPLPQKGNPKPRVFRDKKTQSVINRMGFPGHGASVFFDNLAKFRSEQSFGIVGVNIGKNKDTQDAAADYLSLITRFAPFSDYIAVNISSPNTPGLRDLQKREFLKSFLVDLKQRRAEACVDLPLPPILIKLAPDLADFQIDEISETFLDVGVDGIILSNTTLDRPETLSPYFKKEMGGLSGRLLHHKSTVTIRRFYQTTQGKIPIIGVGGISSAEDAYTKIKAGASLLQLYTALIFQGPAVVDAIKIGLIALLERDGYNKLQEAIGADHR